MTIFEAAHWPCPVDGCDWRLRESEMQPGPRRASGPTVEAAINAMAEGHAKAIDDHLRAHLEGHDVLDFVRTIRRLEQDLYNAGPTGIRPHVIDQVACTCEHQPDARGLHQPNCPAAAPRPFRSKSTTYGDDLERRP